MGLYGFRWVLDIINIHFQEKLFKICFYHDMQEVNYLPCSLIVIEDITNCDCGLYFETLEQVLKFAECGANSLTEVYQVIQIIFSVAAVHLLHFHLGIGIFLLQCIEWYPHHLCDQFLIFIWRCVIIIVKEGSPRKHGAFVFNIFTKFFKMFVFKPRLHLKYSFSYAHPSEYK